MTNQLLNGTFDNQQTQQRETWENGKCVAGVHASKITQSSGSTKYLYPFGHFPDVPREIPGAEPQTGKTVAGYRELTPAEILAMNQLKAASRAFLAELDAVATHLNDADRRWLAIARTDMQTACMAACRAVARPAEDC